MVANMSFTWPSHLKQALLTLPRPPLSCGSESPLRKASEDIYVINKLCTACCFSSIANSLLTSTTSASSPLKRKRPETDLYKAYHILANAQIALATPFTSLSITYIPCKYTTTLVMLSPSSKLIYETLLALLFQARIVVATCTRACREPGLPQ